MTDVTIRAAQGDPIGACLPELDAVVRLIVGHVHLDLHPEQARQAARRLTEACEQIWTCDGCGAQHFTTAPMRNRDGNRYCGIHCSNAHRTELEAAS